MERRSKMKDDKQFVDDEIRGLAEPRDADGLKKLSRALIALAMAQAQAEADAEAEHKGREEEKPHDA
jgi:hypothetical protein